MTKHETQVIDNARRAAAANLPDVAVRMLATLFRSARSDDTRGAAVMTVHALGLADRVTYFQPAVGGGYCMVHVADVPAVRS
jgi:hypothetical protein